jgi:hypothetical protein
MSVRYLYLLASTAILGCAPASSSPGTPGGVQVPRTASYLTGEEIVAANADALNVYDAIARLRPNWLASHGVAVQGSEYAVAYLDGQPYGDLNSLRNIHSYQVADVRYYDITQAGARFGIRGGTGGVIEVRTKVR